MKVDMPTRFWAKVDKAAADSCWEWTAHRLRSGYGWFYTPYGPQGAHRVAAFLSGILPSIVHELHVLHRCDNRKCCNPDHLFLGTNADNARDKAHKGRGRTLRRPGESNPAAKLSAQQVMAVKTAYAKGGISQSKLAQAYGVQQPAISRILTGKRWGVLS